MYKEERIVVSVNKLREDMKLNRLDAHSLVAVIVLF